MCRLWLCTFTLAVSAGAVLLLPLSIIANEALLMFPNSYYLQWINSSLISGLPYTLLGYGRYFRASFERICKCVCLPDSVLEIFMYKKVSYCRMTARHSILVSLCYVSRGVRVRNVSNSKSDL